MNAQGITLLGEAAKDYVTFKYVELFVEYAVGVAIILALCWGVRWAIKNCPK